MSLTTPKLKVLISGAGIAGPCLAYWLSKTPLNPSITIVERSPVPRVTGQSIDIRGPAIHIIRKMGLEQAVRARSTTEEGTRIITSTGRTIAEFGKGNTFTAEHEILRADLCGLFLSATQTLPNVNYMYADTITHLAQTDNSANVTFKSGKQETYDLVVGADGSTSKLRGMMLSSDTLQNSYNFIGQYVAFFSIPSRPTDTKHWYWYAAPKGLGLMTRPHRTPSTIGCYMCITTRAHGVRDDAVEVALEQGVAAQKRILQQRFAHGGWQAERIIDGMQASEDFYMSRMAQVKLPQWHAHRAVLVGDAAHATFGIGTSLAIQGAYRLAGEISRIRSGDDVPHALDEFEKGFREITSKSEDLPPGFPQFGFPQSMWGLKATNSVLWLISKTKAYKLLPDGDKETSVGVPEYNWVGM